MNDYDEAGRCPTCDSRRHVGACTGFPGAIYVPRGQGWFTWEEAHQHEAEGHEVHWNEVWSYSYYGITPPERIVVVDTETTGLDPRINEMIEVAWFDMTHDREIHSAIVPHTLADHSPEALRINRYMERDLGESENWCDPHRLIPVLEAVFEGAAIAGSHVSFDRDFITAWQPYVGTWAHTPLEIGSAAMGFLGRRHPLRLREIPEALGLTRQPDHTAAGDVGVVVEALNRMWSQSDER